MILSRPAWPCRPCPLRQSHHARYTTHAIRAVSTETIDEISAKDLTGLLGTLTQPDMAIAELHLEMGDVEIKVRRNVSTSTATAAVSSRSTPSSAAAGPPSGMAAVATVIAPEPHLQPALHLAPAPYVSVDNHSIEDSMDESQVYVTANRVGIFRRGKSKSKVGDHVKKGEVLGAIEQLGTMIDVKSPQEGEIVAFKVTDGEPVEYGGPIVALAPFFNLEDAGKTSLRGLR